MTNVFLRGGGGEWRETLSSSELPTDPTPPWTDPDPSSLKLI